ncbi:MAG: hypothetical protein IT449_09430 [Phycisphaerales bacterium]|nr:hypothetical protein [Phycisphaerales bacterium]
MLIRRIAFAATGVAALAALTGCVNGSVGGGGSALDSLRTFGGDFLRQALAALLL